jgi:hypothetical protein
VLARTTVMIAEHMAERLGWRKSDATSADA